MNIQFYKTIVKRKKPKNNKERGYFGIVGETDKFYILCEKNSSQYNMYSRRIKFLKSTFEEKFSESDSWRCHNCGKSSYTWRCFTCWS